MTEVVTQIKYLRISPKKMRLVANVIRDLNPQDALNELKFMPKNAAGPLADALASALANAKNNFKLEPTSLRIKTLEINEGTRLKRWRAVSRGVAHQFKRRTSHIRIVLEETQNQEPKTKNLTSEKENMNQRKEKASGTKS